MTALASPTGSFSFIPAGLATFSPTGHIGEATGITIPYPPPSIVPYDGLGYFAPSGGDSVTGALIDWTPSTFTWAGPGAYLVGYTNLLSWNGGNSKFAATQMLIEQEPSGGVLHPDGQLTIHFFGIYTDANSSFGSTGELNFALTQQTDHQAAFMATFTIPSGTSPIPEPGTMIVMGTALIGLGLIRRLSKR